MKNEITLKKPNVPLRAYPEKDLDVELKKFTSWVTILLGLTGEESARRIVAALPAIKKHFWSLGLGEVKKAFEMYADGELRTQPIPNYLDRILVGKIFHEYRDLKPRPKTPVVSNEEISEAKKLDWVLSGIRRIKKEFEETGNIGPGNAFIYDSLYEAGDLRITNARKRELFEQAKRNNKKSDSILDKIVNGPDRAVVEAKRLALLEWLEIEKQKDQEREIVAEMLKGKPKKEPF